MKLSKHNLEIMLKVKNYIKEKNSIQIVKVINKTKSSKQLFLQKLAQLLIKKDFKNEAILALEKAISAKRALPKTNQLMFIFGHKHHKEYILKAYKNDMKSKKYSMVSSLLVSEMILANAKLNEYLELMSNKYAFKNDDFLYEIFSFL